MAEVGRAVLARRGADGNEQDFGTLQRIGQARGEEETLVLRVALDQRFEARLIDGHHAGAQQLHAAWIAVHADDLVSQLGQTAGGHQPHIPCSDHGNFHVHLLCSWSDDESRA
jgi:hypothetical protein